MKVTSAIGAVVLLILAFSIAYIPLLLSSYPTYTPLWKGRDKVVRSFSLPRDLVAGVRYVNFNVYVRAGMIYCNLTDTPMLYKILFKQSIDSPKPIVSYIRNKEAMDVKVFALSGDVKITLNRNYLYNSSVEVETGGINFILSQESTFNHVELRVKYAGAVSVTLLDNASFNSLLVSVNTGGTTLLVDGTSFRGFGRAYLEVKVGEASTFIKGEPEFGVRILASVEIGDVFINPKGFASKKSLTSCVLKTRSYEKSVNRVDFVVKVGLGAVSINKPLILL